MEAVWSPKTPFYPAGGGRAFKTSYTLEMVVGSFSEILFYPEDGGSKFFRNVILPLSLK
jgi:hypothetical protein